MKNNKNETKSVENEVNLEEYDNYFTLKPNIKMSITIEGLEASQAQSCNDEDNNSECDCVVGRNYIRVKPNISLDIKLTGMTTTICQ